LKPSITGIDITTYTQIAFVVPKNGVIIAQVSSASANDALEIYDETLDCRIFRADTLPAYSTIAQTIETFKGHSLKCIYTNANNVSVKFYPYEF